jgi:hypothetical protein
MAEYTDKPKVSGTSGSGSRLVPRISPFPGAEEHEVFERGQSARPRIGVTTEIISPAEIGVGIEPFTGTAGKIVEKRNVAAGCCFGSCRNIPFGVEERVGVK